MIIWILTFGVLDISTAHCVEEILDQIRTCAEEWFQSRLKEKNLFTSLLDGVI